MPQEDFFLILAIPIFSKCLIAYNFVAKLITLLRDLTCNMQHAIIHSVTNANF